MPASKLTVSPKPYSLRSGDLLLLCFADGKTPCFPKGHVPRRFARTAAPKKRGGKQLVFAGEVSGKRLVVRAARLDAEHSNPPRELRMRVAAALNEARGLGCRRVVVALEGRPELCEAVQEGALLGGYVFDRYKKKAKKPLPVQLVVKADAPTSLRRQLSAQAKTLECVNFARDVLNEPANVIYPASLAEAFTDFGTEAGLDVTVWDEKKLAKERCGGVLAVGQASSQKPRLVIGRYAPKGAKAHLALVGKGVTFDTGGYCLKTAAAQKGMKMDMGGAAMVFGAACAIARAGLPLAVSVYTPLAHNDISSTAYHTTDVLTLRSGRTVQVDNTDAEGRLLLADALDVAKDDKPDWIIDAATLTGACVIGLGEDIAAAYSTDPDLTRDLLAAAEEVGEHLWEMPLHQPYRTQLETPIADTSNIGGRWGGSITAALFLHAFVPKGLSWVHMDVAGPAGKGGTLEHLGKGGKGYGVKTLTALARRLCAAE